MKKNILITIVFLMALILGLFAVNGQGQNQKSDLNCCCPLNTWTVGLKGKISGGNYYAQNLITMRTTSVLIYSIRSGEQKVLRTNIFGNYATTVDACEQIIVHPTQNGKGVNLPDFVVFTPTNVFRDLFYNPVPEGIWVQNFEMNVLTLGQ